MFWRKKAHYKQVPLLRPGALQYTRNYLLKALGLEALSLLGSKNPETPKPIYVRSFWTSLARSCVHIVPVSVSIIVITINLTGLYLGGDYSGVIHSQELNSLLLQVAAKLHELTIVASLAVIISNEIRRKLVQGEGIPLGSLGGAFLFTSVNYLWSSELWGSLRSSASKRSKARLYLLLITCILLAALVGPSTATLIIPRMQWFKAGGAKLWIRLNSEDFYPVQLPGRVEVQNILCSQTNSTDYPLCPSYSYKTLSSLATSRTLLQYNARTDQQTDYILTMNDPRDVTIQTGIPNARSMGYQSSFRGADCQTGVIGSRLSEAMKIEYFWHDFDGATHDFPWTPSQPTYSFYKYRHDDTVYSKTRIPVVKTACSAPVNLSQTSTQVTFPILVQNDCWVDQSTYQVENLTQKQSSGYYTTWTQLPASFGPTSAGLVFQGPIDASSNTSLAIGCSISAGWVNGSITPHDMNVSPSAFWTHRGIPDYQTPWNRTFYINADPPSPPQADDSWQTIELQEDWLHQLTPVVGENGLTTLDSVIEQSWILHGLPISNTSQVDAWAISEDRVNRTVTLEYILAMMIADGLSREGAFATVDTSQQAISINADTMLDMGARNDQFATRLFQDNDPYAQPAGMPSTYIHVDMMFQGLRYKSSSVSDYLAMTALFVHLILALVYTIWSLSMIRESSDSWHSLTELIALAHNSKPSSNALNNTGAGIKELNTHSRMAVVRAVHSEEEQAGSAGKLELVFIDDVVGSPEVKRRKVKTNSNSTINIPMRQISQASTRSATPELQADTMCKAETGKLYR